MEVIIKKLEDKVTNITEEIKDVPIDKLKIKYSELFEIKNRMLYTDTTHLKDCVDGQWATFVNTLPLFKKMESIDKILSKWHSLDKLRKTIKDLKMLYKMYLKGMEFKLEKKD